MRLYEIHNEKMPKVYTPNPQEIADKHNVSIKLIMQQLAMGIKVEMEHTGDRALSKEIALDHLNEFPDYYTRLKKVEEDDTLNPPSISVGDEVKVGKFKNRKAEVKGFKKDKNGQPVLKTNKGDQQLYKPRVSKLEPKNESGASMRLDQLLPEADQVKAKEKKPKKVKPSKGGSSPHPYRGRLVGESRQDVDIEGGKGKGKKLYSADASVDDHLSAMKYHTHKYQQAKFANDDTDAMHHAKKYHQHKDQIEALSSKGDYMQDSVSLKEAISVAAVDLPRAVEAEVRNFLKNKQMDQNALNKLLSAIGLSLEVKGNRAVIDTLKKYAEEGSDPCWKGYKMVGQKKKGGKKVPNCVPKESVERGKFQMKLDSKSSDDYMSTKKSAPKKRTHKQLRKDLVAIGDRYNVNVVDDYENYIFSKKKPKTDGAQSPFTKKPAR